MTLDIDRVVQMLPHMRWFGHKDRSIAGAEVVDQVTLAEGPPQLLLVLLELDLGGSKVVYNLPLLVDQEGNIRDAPEEPGKLSCLGELMAHGRSLPGQKGSFVFGGAGLDPSSPPGSSSIRMVSAEQSNSSIIMDERTILKMFRRVERGPNPDLELNRFLTAEGFPHVAVQVGEIAYESEEEEGFHLGLAQAFLPDAREGWTEIVAGVRSLLEQADEADAVEDIGFLVSERSSETMAAIAELGDVTAAMHIVLSREGIEPDFAPEAVEHEDLKDWIAQTQSKLDEGDVARSPEVEGLAPELGRVAARPGSVADGGMKTRVHGDYHLGQVLLSARGWVVTDFEGEPARSLEERRAKTSPLRDVAGMLRSFGYAAASPLFELAEPGSDAWGRLEPWARAWEDEARTRFLDAYLSKSHEGVFLPQDRDDALALIDLFELDKALYEVGYERSHRPDWVRIPLHGLTRLAERAND